MAPTLSKESETTVRAMSSVVVPAFERCSPVIFAFRSTKSGWKISWSEPLARSFSSRKISVGAGFPKRRRERGSGAGTDSSRTYHFPATLIW